MDPIRWKFTIRADVEDTKILASSKGFSVRELEGQPKNYGEPYPLNQIEVEGWDLSSNVKVIVSPNVTQVYFSIKDIPGIDEMESIVADLGKVEQILNEIVVFAPNESLRFSTETEIPVMSNSMLKTQQRFTSEFHKILENLQELVLREATLAFVHLALGEISYGKKRFEILLHDLTEMHKGLIQMAKEQGIKEAEKWEEELNKSILASEQLEIELASAHLRDEINWILKKYLKSLLKH